MHLDLDLALILPMMEAYLIPRGGMQMKTSILLSALSLCLVLIGLAFSSEAQASRNAEMIEVERLVESLEADYRLNIRLIPQRTNSERLWLQDLMHLSNILDNNLPEDPDSIRTLTCDKIVCRQL